jgi:hypothetical protein
MANLTENPVWEEGIYQFETSDPVMGGPNGIDNKPTGQLANRTGYLKKKLEELEGKTLPDASTTKKGVVQLSSETGSDDEDKAATPKAVKEAIGLAKSASIPIGAVVAFPRSVTNPAGFLKLDGTTFAQAAYPNLYTVLGSNKLPDLTRSDVGMTAYWPVGDIPDGWIKYDEIATRVTQSAYPELYRKLVAQYGSISAVPKADDRFLRNASGSLTVGTQQGDAIRNITGEAKFGYDGDTVYDPNAAASTSAIYYPDRKAQDTVNNMSVFANSANNWRPLVFDASRSVPVADEVRPKALVMVLCIKAKNTTDDVVFWIKAAGEAVNTGLLDASKLSQDIQAEKAARERLGAAVERQIKQRIDAALRVACSFKRVGDFTVRKFADGTMIQTGSVSITNHGNAAAWRELVWPEAFAGQPQVFAAARVVTDARDTIITVNVDDAQNTAAKCSYNIWETSYTTNYTAKVDFMAIGRYLPDDGRTDVPAASDEWWKV